MDEQINCQKIKEEIKLVSIKELPFVMEIINDAKELLRSCGSLQWNLPDNYPHEMTMLNDIQNQVLYTYCQQQGA